MLRFTSASTRLLPFGFTRRTPPGLRSRTTRRPGRDFGETTTSFAARIRARCCLLRRVATTAFTPFARRLLSAARSKLNGLAAQSCFGRAGEAVAGAAARMIEAATARNAVRSRKRPGAAPMALRGSVTLCPSMIARSGDVQTARARSARTRRRGRRAGSAPRRGRAPSRRPRPRGSARGGARARTVQREHDGTGDRQDPAAAATAGAAGAGRRGPAADAVALPLGNEYSRPWTPISGRSISSFSTRESTSAPATVEAPEHGPPHRAWRPRGRPRARRRRARRGRCWPCTALSRSRRSGSTS